MPLRNRGSLPQNQSRYGFVLKATNLFTQRTCVAFQNKQQIPKAAAKRSPKPASSQSSRDSSKSGTPVAGASERPAALIIDYTSTHLEPEASPSPPPMMPSEESSEQKDAKEESPSASGSREGSARPTRQSKGAASRAAKRTTPPQVDPGAVRRSKRKCTTPAYLHIMCMFHLLSAEVQ